MESMTSKSKRTNWNELEYISWKEFKQMAPSIVKLESSRLEKVIQTVQPGNDVYNALIKARYELKQFIRCLDQTEKPPISDKCADHLNKAILSLSIESTGLNDKIIEAVDYILDRLNYVHNRLGMIYE